MGWCALAFADPSPIQEESTAVIHSVFYHISWNVQRCLSLFKHRSVNCTRKRCWEWTRIIIRSVWSGGYLGSNSYLPNGRWSSIWSRKNRNWHSQIWTKLSTAIFYLNRTVSKIWKHVPSEKTAEDLLSYTYQSNRQSQLTVNIIWGVLNYSEPSTHPELIQPNSCWRTHRGENFTHENNARFSKCGGIGGDWTGSDSVLKYMEETGGFFRKVFSLVRQEKRSDPSFPTIWINWCACPVHADIT